MKNLKVRRLRRTQRAALALLTVAVSGAVTTGMSPASKGEAATRQAAIPGPSSPRTLPSHTESSPLLATSGERCEPTLKESKERKAGATQACVSTASRPVKPSSRVVPKTGLMAPKSFAGSSDTGSCEVTSPGMYTYKRFQYCVTGVNVLYTLRDGNGKELGTGTLTVSTSANLSNKATKWDESVTVTMTGATGAVTSLSAKFRSSCTQPCTATKTAPWYGGDLTTGQSATGSVSYSSSPASGSQAEFTTSYKLYVTAPGAQVTDPNASWSNPRKIRCDDAVGNAAGSAAPGCVIPTVMAVVPMSAQGSDPGGAVAAYQWAQQNLADGWGQNKPLTRERSGTAGRTDQTCGSAGTQPFEANTDLVANDTCAEFPFAEAKEGGVDGARCVEVIPNSSSGGWDTYILGDSLELDRSAPCVRAHVPPAEKQFADSQLSAGFESQRVIDADQFKVEFTTPAAVPQAPCLSNWPTDALPSGGGWIENTTEPIANVNKTTTPIGAAGTRPARAQACLTRPVGTGKPASGDPTGWQDAQIFARPYAAPNTPAPYGLARCHLIAKILGGPGRVRDGGQKNLVPCWQVGMNTGTPSMRTYEAEAEKKLADASFGANDAILYQVTPVFRDATSTIPVGVTMTANIERANGTTELLFPNVFVPNTKEDTGKFNLGN